MQANFPLLDVGLRVLAERRNRDELREDAQFHGRCAVDHLLLMVAAVLRAWVAPGGGDQ
jgi:hypothetical protein